MAHSGRFFSFLREPVLWREEAVRTPGHCPTCRLYHELSSSPPPYLSRDAPSSGAAEAPTSAASPVTRLPQSVLPAPPRHTSGRPGHTERAKIVHSDFCAPSSFPRRHKGSRERRRCPLRAVPRPSPLWAASRQSAASSPSRYRQAHFTPPLPPATKAVCKNKIHIC